MKQKKKIDFQYLVEKLKPIETTFTENNYDEPYEEP